MFIPSMSILVLAVTGIATLMVADWYVWGMTYASDFRLPRRIRPLGAAEIIDRALGRLITANEAMLPLSVVDSVHTPIVSDESEGAGFKKVA